MPRGNHPTVSHNPSPYLRRYRLPVLPFQDSSYDDLLSPVDHESKMDFIEWKNQRLKENFDRHVSTSTDSSPCSSSSSDSPQTKPKFHTEDEAFAFQSRQFNRLPNHVNRSSSAFTPTRIPMPPSQSPWQPIRPQNLELEKLKMCREITEMERRTREIYDRIKFPGSNERK
uniref:Uncharacterized protein n=1 Tax=Acrobeloides nanus TaxID=290746 RepID=A0A914DXX3_9BILA